jgi:protein-S-isoprenylcysteine O-methyltransferase Ste14
MNYFIRILILETILGGILFASAGRMDLPWFWVFIASHIVMMAVGLRLIDPGLREERFHPGPGGKDRYMRWTVMPFLIGQLVAAGLDVGRYQWSSPMPFVVQVLGMAGYVFGCGVSFWAMAVNRFFSPVVRIQEERGHHLITEGPYGYVRHPGYAGVLLAVLCCSLALGSWWSLAIVAAGIFLFIRRVVIEDRFLFEELPGYPEYAQKVRYRIIPGVW